MKFYLDCEFDGYGGELLSLALVPERKSLRSLYWVRDPMPPITDQWVAENVIPLMDIDTASVGSLAHLARYLEDHLKGLSSVHIIADWPDDIAYFCKALLVGPGQRIDTPPLTFEVVRLDAYPTTLPGAVQHNALWDAMALRHLMATPEPQP